MWTDVEFVVWTPAAGSLLAAVVIANVLAVAVASAVASLVWLVTIPCSDQANAAGDTRRHVRNAIGCFFVAVNMAAVAVWWW